MQRLPVLESQATHAASASSSSASSSSSTPLTAASAAALASAAIELRRCAGMLLTWAQQAERLTAGTGSGTASGTGMRPGAQEDGATVGSFGAAAGDAGGAAVLRSAGISASYALPSAARLSSFEPLPDTDDGITSATAASASASGGAALPVHRQVDHPNPLHHPIATAPVAGEKRRHAAASLEPVAAYNTSVSRGEATGSGDPTCGGVGTGSHGGIAGGAPAGFNPDADHHAATAAAAKRARFEAPDLVASETASAAIAWNSDLYSDHQASHSDSHACRGPGDKR